MNGIFAEGTLLAFLRIVAFFVVSPFPGPLVPPTVRVILSAGLAFSLTPLDTPAFAGNLWIQAILEIGIGLAAGFLLTLPLAAFSSAGELVGAQMGVSAASMIDPYRLHGGVIATLYQTVALAIFAVGDGPLRLTTFLARSLELMPPGSASLSGITLSVILTAGSQVLLAMLQVAAPVVTAVFAAQLVLAVLARAVPTMNLFVEGPGLTMSAGVLGLLASVHTFIPLVDRIFGARFEEIATWMLS